MTDYFPGQHPWDNPLIAQNFTQPRPEWTYAYPVVDALVNPNDLQYAGYDGQRRYYADRALQAGIEMQRQMMMAAAGYVPAAAAVASGPVVAPIVTIL